MPNVRHVLILLPVNRGSAIAEIIAAARHILNQMTANREIWFPTPNAPLGTLSAETERLVLAESNARKGTKGAAQARDTVLVSVYSQLENQRQYVQTIADANTGREIEIAAAAGMVTKKAPAHHEKEPIVASITGTDGEAYLEAKAVDKGCYEWQKSVDKGGTWTPAGISTWAHLTLKGLVSGTDCLFRVRAVVGETPGEWFVSKEFKVP